MINIDTVATRMMTPVLIDAASIQQVLLLLMMMMKMTSLGAGAQLPGNFFYLTPHVSYSVFVCDHCLECGHSVNAGIILNSVRW